MGQTPEMCRCRSQAAARMHTRRGKQLLRPLFGGHSDIASHYDERQTAEYMRLNKAVQATRTHEYAACATSRVGRLEQLHTPGNSDDRLLRRLAALVDEFERVEARCVSMMSRLLELSDALPVSDRCRRNIVANTSSLVVVHRDVLLPGIRAALLPLGLVTPHDQTSRERQLPVLNASSLTIDHATKAAEDLSRLFARAAPLLLLHGSYLVNTFKARPTAALARCTGRWANTAARQYVGEHGEEMRRLLATPQSRLPRWNLAFRDLVYLLSMDERTARSSAMTAAVEASQALACVCVYLNEEIADALPRKKLSAESCGCWGTLIRHDRMHT